MVIHSIYYILLLYYALDIAGFYPSLGVPDKPICIVQILNYQFLPSGNLTMGNDLFIDGLLIKMMILHSKVLNVLKVQCGPPSYALVFKPHSYYYSYKYNKP
jgi:hypothetical protein